MSTFAAPATPTGVDLNELNGALLYIKVNSFTPAVQTSYGPTDTVSVDLVVLDGDKKGEERDDVMLFPKILVSSLKKFAGSEQIVLARLSKGTAKPGQSAPWVLTAPTQEDIAIATRYQEYAKKRTEEQAAPF